jgi:hypothetical protein
MATTKKTAAKKTSAAKKAAATKTSAAKTTTVAKKSSAAKTSAAKRSTAAKKAAATKQANAVRESISSVTKGADDTIKQYTAVAGDQLVEMRQLVRDVVDIYVGIPFVLGTRVADSATTPNVDLDALKSFLDDAKARLAVMPSVDFDAVKAFLDEAKTVGHAQVAAFENQVGAAASTASKRFDTASKRFDEATAKLGAQLPAQVAVAFESGRARLRSLYAA